MSILQCLQPCQPSGEHMYIEIYIKIIIKQIYIYILTQIVICVLYVYFSDKDNVIISRLYGFGVFQSARAQLGQICNIQEIQREDHFCPLQKGPAIKWEDLVLVFGPELSI